MRVSAGWSDYELIDCSDGERLERWGDIILIRPDPSVIWKTERVDPLWKKADARYKRSSSGGGSWVLYNRLPAQWTIHYKSLSLNVRTMGFKHTGIFPEQAVNWDYTMKKIKASERRLKVLNLFGYTGAATVAALSAGASVTHVDASRGMVTWARENAVSSGVEDKPVRWLVDDCKKFVEREIRRGNTYDIIIMDPPSYGRGPGGEVWKLEDELSGLVELCSRLMNEDSCFFMLSSYTAGLSCGVMEYIISSVFRPGLGGVVKGEEIGLPVTDSGFILPCGSTVIWENTK